MKLDKFNEEIRFLGKYGIETMDDLIKCKKDKANEMELLRQERKQNPNRNEEIKKELTQLRKDLRICDRIADRSTAIQEKRKQIREKEMTEHESLGRCGRTGRADDLGRN